MMTDSGKSGQKRSKAGCGTGTAEATGKVWRKRLLPLLVCLVFVPAPFALAANSGGQENVPGTGDYGNDTPSGNTVTIDSDVGNDVIGGYAITGAADNNRITMTGGTVGHTVYGGIVDGNGTATGNSVTMSGGTIDTSFNGAYVNNGVVSGNSATVTGSAQVGWNVNGAYVTNGNASGNSATVTGGATVEGYVYGGYTGNGTVSGNSVTVSDSTVGYVMGGYASTGTAENNRVKVTNSDVTGSGGSDPSYVAGGYTYYQGTGTVRNNQVEVTGTTVDNVYGGWAHNGIASGNSVILTDGTAKEVFGANVHDSGSATGNSVTVAGDATVSLDIYGGFVHNFNGTATEGDATGNTVTLATGAGANLASAIVYGGNSNVAGADVKTGNTLNVDTGHVEVKNIANFQTVNLNVNAETAPTAGQAMLALNDTAGTDLSGTQVNMQGAIAGGTQTQPLATTVTLIENANGLTTDANTLSGTAIVRQGVSLNHHYTLQADSNTLTATYDNRTTVDPATGVFTNGRLATVGFLNEGTDFALDTGMTKAMETIRAKGYGAYGAIRGSDIRHDLDKGGDAEVSGTHWLLGLAGKLNTARDYDLIGSIYAEAGWGNIDSDNSFASGHGDTHYYGIGLIGRYQQNEGTMKGAYAQINAKIGRASTDLESNLYDVNGNRGEYDEDSTYYGAGVGVGYLWEITQAYTLDLSARYQWLHLDGYNTDIANDPYKFDDIDSHRTKVGARLNYTENKQYTPYIGVAWEHEFSGSARGSVYGYSLDDNSLKGDTGVAEIGVTFSPTADSAWKIDANLQGYAGQREGVAGNLVVNYLF
ncbi:autotransporter domain-containing protein [Oxalobacter sp. OxGP1]|uniref:autotransporter domain-containing protein n=1 Tax=Oxalobacter paeniformigenes TaxID=2946594 RepID=UPI0022AE9709|nr:autotransporter domain-containing protein [Oxalobacter paeniformigenes]MCZ4052595.1 autotransporter domain-containing protein [Oxalobacter paeniformigenes]